MNLFDDFDTTQLALRRPPANDSLQTFKELQELNNLNVDRNVVEDKDGKLYIDHTHKDLSYLLNNKNKKKIKNKPL